MDMRKRRDAHLAYIADEKAVEEIISCRKILQKLNFRINDIFFVFVHGKIIAKFF